jgi:opacity protein-like surface antigen
LLLSLGAASAFSQPFSFGVKAGVPLTDFLAAARSQSFSFSANSHRYIAGATVELRLPLGLAVEADVLYRRLNYEGSGSSLSSQTTGNAWEFPLLAKYRLPGKFVRPYVDAGLAWDTLSGVSQTIRNVLPTGATTAASSNPAELKKSTTSGFVMGVGVDVKVLVIHLSPEIRYTRWGSQHFIDPSGLLHSNQSQAEFLVGITF